MSTPERDRADAVRARYTAELTRIDGDTDINEDARRRRKAEAWTKARRELDTLKATEAERLTKREAELERRLFGAPTTAGPDQAISARDAQDRVSRLTSPEDAARLLHQAEMNADTVLARTIAQHAVRQGRGSLGQQARAWDDVLGTYINARPDTQPIVQELAEIERLTTRQVLNAYSLPQPHGVTPADINTARPAAAPEAAEPAPFFHGFTARVSA